MTVFYESCFYYLLILALILFLIFNLQQKQSAINSVLLRNVFLKITAM